MSKTACSLHHLPFFLLYTYLQLNWFWLFNFSSCSCLSISCFTPTIYLTLAINSYWVIWTTSNLANWIFPQHFGFFWCVILEKVRNKLRRWDCLCWLQETELTFKASSPTEQISYLTKSQSVMCSTSYWNDVFVLQFSEQSGFFGKNTTTKS